MRLLIDARAVRLRRNTERDYGLRLDRRALRRTRSMRRAHDRMARTAEYVIAAALGGAVTCIVLLIIQH
jgi:hypothetical protein